MALRAIMPHGSEKTIILEVGRVTNLVYGQALKTSGDAVFPAVIAAVFMYVCAVGGTWMFGLHLGFLATGAYIGLTCDECVRSVRQIPGRSRFRWRECRIRPLSPFPPPETARWQGRAHRRG